MLLGNFPSLRLRRLRQASWIRDLVTETTLSPKDFIWPLFIREPEGKKIIEGMPGVYRYTLEELPEIAQEAANAGICALMLFPYTPEALKTPSGQEALNPDNLICRAIRLLHSLNLPLGIITDVALDPYTDHGHDGVILNGKVDNDATIEILKQQALLQAEAGASCLAPSDMMDGRIGALRDTLNNHHFHDILIMSYGVKFASHFYGPFRQAVGVKGLKTLPHKKTYQINPANRQEALRDIGQDIKEGADMVIVKPGLPYIDIIREASHFFHIPLLAYQVSGEYSMIQAAHERGMINGPQVMLECLLSIKRAGAQSIITYGALDMARFLQA